MIKRQIFIFFSVVILVACQMPAPNSTSGIASIEPTQSLANTPEITPLQSPTSTPTPLPTPVVLFSISDGDQALFIGDWEAALEIFTNVLDTSSDPELRSAALLGLGRTQLYLRDYETALQTLQTLLSGPG